MADIQKLKALAEAAPTGPWYPPDEGSSIGMVFDCDLGSLLSYESIDSERDACVAYVAAANPATVLELIAEIERLREVMSCVVNEIPRSTHRDGNAPGHCHTIPGIWDRDNGGKAGTECGWCKVWNAAVSMSKESSHEA